MSTRAVRALGGFVLLAYLALLLATDDIGLGTSPRAAEQVAAAEAAGADATELRALTYRWPYVFEDVYDRGAYQRRGRWLPAHATPYLQEFSEYPQLTTWTMGLPYLFFDHGIEPGSPFETVERSRARLLALGVPADGLAILFDQFEKLPYDASAYEPDSQHPLHGFVVRIERQAGADSQAGLLAFDAAWRALAGRTEELKRNRVGYGRWHQVLMLGWYLLLFLTTVQLLATFGRPPAWALLLLLPGGLYYGFNRSDLPMMAMIAVAFLLQCRERRLAAAFALGVAIMIKWAPLALVPLFLSFNFHRALERERSAGRAPRIGPLLLHQVVAPGAVLGAFVLVVLAVTWVWDGGGLDAVWFVVDWHLHVREPNHASLLSLLTHPTRLAWFSMEDRGWLSKLGLLMQFAPAFAAALLPLRSRDSLARASVLALVGMVVFSKFFSPQWVVWPGFLCVFLAARQPLYAAGFALLNLVVYVQLPLLYYPFMRGEDAGLFWGWTYARVVLLLGFWLFALVDFARRVRAESDEPALAAKT